MDIGYPEMGISNPEMDFGKPEMKSGVLKWTSATLKSKSISLDVSLAKTLAATKFVLLMVIKLLTSSADDVG